MLYMYVCPGLSFSGIISPMFYMSVEAYYFQVLCRRCFICLSRPVIFSHNVADNDMSAEIYYCNIILLCLNEFSKFSYCMFVSLLL